MYHPGKVLAVIKRGTKDVISSDSSSQAVLDMWDENQLTFNVDNKLAARLKEGDIVLVDYTQEARGNLVLPRHLVVKILRGSTAKAVWDSYKDYHKKRRGKPATSEGGEKSQENSPENSLRYFG